MGEWLTATDTSLFHYINLDMASPFLDAIMPLFRNRLTWIPLYILLGIYTVRKHGSDGWSHVVFIVLVFAVSDSVTYHVVKPFFHRARPCYDDALQARLVLEHCGGKWGFPSSHATNHMALSVSIILCGIFRNGFMNFLVILWALLVGFAQVYVGVHYPTDILAGWVWGAAVSVALFFIFKPAGRKNWGG